MIPELIADYQCEIGEGPLWHPMEKRVYWTDIPRGRMFRYDPATGKHEQFYEGDIVGGFTIQADGSLLLFQGGGAIRIWKDGKLTTLIEEVLGEGDSRFNDVIADPEGRVFCGTMAVDAHPGSLYRLDLDGTIQRLYTGFTISNGMGFTPDLKQMYHTDSPAREIYRYDYDRATGGLSNRQLFFRIADTSVEPDGMTVDVEGCVWTALWGGSAVVRFSPEGRELQRIPFPNANQVSCAAFGGDDRRDMYVTTAGGQNKAETGAEAGSLYRLQPGVTGGQEFLSRIRL